jgi:hypothetical protein
VPGRRHDTPTVSAVFSINKHHKRLFAASTKASDVVGAPYIRHMDNAVWRALPHIKFIRPRDCGQHTIETNDNIKTKPFEDNSARFF